MLLALCEGNPQVTSGIPSQRPLTGSLYIYIYILWSAHEQTLEKQSRLQWFETPSRPFWRHSKDLQTAQLLLSVQMQLRLSTNWLCPEQRNTICKCLKLGHFSIQAIPHCNPDRWKLTQNCDDCDYNWFHILVPLSRVGRSAYYNIEIRIIELNQIIIPNYVIEVPSSHHFTKFITKYACANRYFCVAGIISSFLWISQYLCRVIRGNLQV